ncbi:MAG: hypothetical protein KDA25_05350, partial [Phycisphaerales bacterium]|nr:hypothetical protein [Phycisphaerales bacterium]
MSGWSLVLQSLVLSGAVIALVLLLLLDRRVGRGRAAAAVALLVLVAVIGGLVYARQTQSRVRSGAHLVAKTPELFDATSGFVRSTTCRACHPGQYATWHATFHRTMTQLATPDAVVGDFDDRRLENRGRTYHLTRRGDEFWVNLVDPDAEHDLVSRGIYPNTVPDLPRVNRRVVMTTGSHAQQTCWLESRDGRRLLNLPFVWLIEEARWVPREDVFLRPPHGGRGFDQWNNNCIECHCVSGDENLNEHGIPESRVAELGITCEACHGPAAAHVQANRDPLRRYRTHLSAAGDPTIVNPRTLAQAASAQVCGQCHGMNVRKNDVARTGLSYRAGDALTDTKMILQISDPHRSPAEEADWARLQRHIANQPEGFV